MQYTGYRNTIWRYAQAPQPQVRSPQAPRPRRRALLGGRCLLTVSLLAMALLGAGVGLWRAITPAEAACPSHIVVWGDTLSKIATQYHTTVATLAKLNHIQDVNLIYTGQKLCVGSGNPTHDRLEWSNRAQVRTLLIAAADRRGLPRSLVLAIGWQESGWTQHVIAWDGGIGAMQIMPYTAVWLNRYFGTSYDPYRLHDNIELGTRYLRLLWNSFHGDLQRIVSAYNEGERNVRTRGIFNWRYVNSVLALMRRFD